MITINCTTRTKTTKGSVGRDRREGVIPFVIYSQGQTAHMGKMARTDVEAAIRSLRPGFLTTTVFVLKDENGKERQAVVREIQYKPTTYEVLHIDFLELIKDRAISIKIPVEFLNMVDCVGIKLGGMLRQTMRHVRVQCLPKNIPSHFQLDLKDTSIGQAKRVKDIILPAGVTSLEPMNGVIASIVKK